MVNNSIGDIKVLGRMHSRIRPRLVSIKLSGIFLSAPLLAGGCARLSRGEAEAPTKLDTGNTDHFKMRFQVISV